MSLKERIRRRETPFWDAIYRVCMRVRYFTLPRLRWLGRVLSLERDFRHLAWHWLRNQYCNQIMAYKCTRLGKGIRWDGDVPLIFGDGEIELSDGVQIGNRQTWVVGLKVFDRARLSIGENTRINYQVTISAAQLVSIGRNCRIAGEVKIFDNNSHPIDPLARREHGGRMSESDIAPVIIEDDVWIGNNCLIMKGVRIGYGAVIAAGSVVTRSVPPLTVVGGNPAAVLKRLESDPLSSLGGRNPGALQVEGERSGS